MYQILEKKILNESVQLMVVLAPFVARKCEPGQFIILRVDDEGERVPLTILDYDREIGSVTIVYQVVGHSTKKLGQLEVGQYINDFAGPLGKATELVKHNRVLGIAGGVGAAPLYPQLKKMHEMGAKVDVIIGGRTSDFVILESYFAEFCDNIYVATNDGSKGKAGFVTDVFNELLAQGEKYDEVITIGPVVMMKAIVNLTKPLGIPTGVSLNPIMIDGTGMCGGCRVTIGNETKFACVDGPDFDGFLVDFDELMRRQNYYKEEEHSCRIR